MISQQIPTLIIWLVVTAYWTYVGRMVQRVRKDAGKVTKVLVPAQFIEKIMWLIWVPLIFAWTTTPLLILLSFQGRVSEKYLQPSPTYLANALTFRYIAAAVAIICLALSIVTWRHMGRQWRMGIDPTQKLDLLTAGPFSRVRHPIYALSILLMLCSLAVVPCRLMFLLAILHITLMHVKARNEEEYLLRTKGPSYAEYCRKTGRFLPLMRSGMPAHVPYMDGSETTPDSPIRGWKAGGVYPYRFNFFQQSMVMWDQLHPYNAVHVVRVRGKADAAAFRSAAWDVAKNAGLGELAINYFGTAYEYRPLQVIRVQQIESGPSAEQQLNDLITEEINTPFYGKVHHPIRWTLFDESEGEAHYVILCYHHAISDAYGIERLFAAVLRKYLGIAPADDDSRLTTQLTRLDRSLHPRTNPINYVIGQIRLSAHHRVMRKVHKMPDERLGGDYTAVAIRTAPGGLIERLTSACKRRNVGVNDALIAAFAFAIAHQTPDRLTSRRRKYLSMATVVGARRNLSPDQADDFGVCLSSIMAILKKPDITITELVHDVARQTKVLKTRPARAAAETNLRYFAIRWLKWMAAVKHERRAYRRVFPICGGVSTVYVDSNRFADLAGHVTRYIRACPTGPVMPLLLGPTIYNGQLELGLTYRIACRTHAQAQDMLDLIVAGLEKIAEADQVVPSRLVERSTV